MDFLWGFGKGLQYYSGICSVKVGTKTDKI